MPVPVPSYGYGLGSPFGFSPFGGSPFGFSPFGTPGVSFYGRGFGINPVDLLVLGGVAYGVTQLVKVSRFCGAREPGAREPQRRVRSAGRASAQ